MLHSAESLTPRLARRSGMELAYLDHGNPAGTPIFFLHGFPDDPTTWDAVVEELGNDRLRFIRPWQRGCGLSRALEETAGGAQAAALAQDVIELADALGIRQFVLVGQDWGSRAAHGVAVLAPSRVSAMLVLATPYGQGSADPETRMRQEQAFWYQWFFQTPHGRERFQSDPKGFCRYLWRIWSPKWEFTAGDFEQTARSFENSQFVETVLHYYAHRWKTAEGRQAYAKQQAVLDSIPPITVPTIFACGTTDACNLVNASRGNESFYHGPYRRVEIPDVGHFVQRERPDLVADLIREALSQIPSAAGRS